MSQPITRNTLFYGDNLDILQEYIPDESVDLIYLDPPFNSNRSYNVLFRDESGRDSEAQITAFEDTWHWGAIAEQTWRELITGDHVPEQVSAAMDAMLRLIGRNQMMAYLVMMTARLVELHRVLKPTGSLYLHCDPTASHYLKMVLDAVFGPRQFRSEIIWKRTAAHSDTKQGSKQPGRIHDVILFYTKGDEWTWNEQYTPYAPKHIETFYRHVDSDGRRYATDNLTAAKPGGNTRYEWRVKRKLPDGDWMADLDNEYLNPKPGYEYKGVLPYKNRYWAYSKENMEQFERKGRLYYTRTGMIQYKRYLDEMPGVPLQDVWTDIKMGPTAPERLGYPTQKPLALLERIIQASSNPGDWVLDPFCGCGTAIAAAQKLGRHWIGIDITHLSIALQKYRLEDMFQVKPGEDYEVVGEPISLAGARQLAQEDRFQFQFWALSLVRAKPLGAAVRSRRGKRGKDRGIDGVINFMDEAKGKPKRVLVQVKSGKVSSRDIRDLVGTVEREEAALGLFITLEPPTRDMVKEAVSAGFYHSPGWGKDFPRVQMLTIEELLEGKQPDMPPAWGTFKQAPRERGGGSGGGQPLLL